MERSFRTSWFFGGLIVVQLIITIIVFQNFIFQADQFLLANQYDGLKNYFHFDRYLHQADHIPYTTLSQINYPFGESIYYTDNTPTLAIAMRWFSIHVFDISNQAISFFNGFILLGFLFSSIFIFLILNRFKISLWITTIASLTLPWIHPQIHRIEGHMNLSFAWIFLATMYLLIRSVDLFPTKKKHFIFKQFLLIVLVLFAAFSHLYYLVILSFLIGGFYFFWFLFERKNWKTYWPFLLSALTIPLISVAITTGVISSTDSYLELRRTTGSGYNWSPFNLNPDALYTSNAFNTIPFPLKSTIGFHYESKSYLGLFSLWGFLFFLVLFLIKKQKRKIWSSYFKQTKEGKVVLILVLATTLCLIISLGDYAKLFNQKLAFDNVLSPFYYLSKLSDRITQFRCIARFNWVFFWGFNFLILYLLNHYLRRHNNRQRFYGLSLGLLLLLSIDSIDSIRYFYQSGKVNVLSIEAEKKTAKKLLNGINTADYQALLVVPFYYTDTGELGFSIDPLEPWTTFSFQLAIVSNLPLFSTRSTRLPKAHAQALFSIFIGGKIDPLLLQKLSNKPILVVQSMDDRNVPVVESSPAKEVLIEGKNVVNRLQLNKINQENDLILYEWDIQKLKQNEGQIPLPMDGLEKKN